MNTPINVLIVEDSEDDALLLVRELQHGGYDVTFEQVETAEALVDALDLRKWDLVISDYTMPHFRGTDALKLVRERDQDIPFIFASGTIGEDSAVAAMRNGANDYVLKGNLKRLLPAIERELREARMRRERRQTEKALWESETRYRTLAEAAQDSIFILDADGGYQYINTYGAQTFGYRPEELIGRSIEDLYPAPVVDRQKRMIQKILETGEGANDELHISISGRERWVESHLVPIKDTGGNINAILGIARDVTERRRGEERLQETTQRLQLATTSGGIGIWDWEIQSNRLIWDDRMFELYGISKESFTSSVEAWKKGIHPEDYTAAMEALQATVRGEKGFDTEFRIIHPDGKVKFLQANGMVIRDADGKPLRMIGMNRDITDRRNLEQQLRQSQKMEAVGTLAGGIAHDFNNALTGIVGFGEILRMRIAEDEQASHDLDEILRCAERATTLTRQLLTYARRQIIEPVNLNVSALVTDLMRLIGKVVGEHIEVKTSLERNVPTIHADRGQIEQVVMNLCLNARDAMPEGGRLVVETEDAFLEEEYVLRYPYMKPGRYAVLSVSDTGVGMDEATRERVFEPFFTTKGPDKGTGLGLAMVYGIIKQHGGFIHLYSEPGKGTAFKVYFPAIEARPDALPAIPREDILRGGTETILLAEDEEAIRGLAERILTGFGYTVLVARNGEEAIEMFRRKKEIVLAVLDVVMPRKGGKEAFEAMRKENPNLKVIFMSGYSANAIHESFILTAGVPFLQKPFSPTILARKVREVLDGK